MNTKIVWQACSECKGTGLKGKNDCPTCEGRGGHYVEVEQAPTLPEDEGICEECYGSTYLWNGQKCPFCKDGRIDHR